MLRVEKIKQIAHDKFEKFRQTFSRWTKREIVRLMGKIMTAHVRQTSWSNFKPSSAEKEPELMKFCVSSRTCGRERRR